MTEPVRAPHELHNEKAWAAVEPLVRDFPDTVDRMIALESVVVGIICSLTTDPELGVEYLKILVEGAMARIKDRANARG